MDKKNDKGKQESKPRDDGVEMENQFIMRLPEEPAKSLQDAIQTGNLKDRIAIKLDNELRYGEVRFDQWLLHAKVVDLPTIVECHKTIDNKNFYKSSDICQMMICKEEPDPIDSEKESPNKAKKKDPNKVDKKYLWPHGITPPCKNVRKRRFRKTLKKKNVEAPEIEKEVKHLLRTDNEAVRVDWEVIISEDIDKALDQNSKEYNEGEDEFNDDTRINETDGKLGENDSSSQKDINIESDDEDAPAGSAPTLHSGVGEHDIFGEEVSSSDDDEGRPDQTRNSREIEESSRLSAEDSRLSDFSMGGGTGGDGGNESRADDSNLATTKDDPTEFNKLMFKNSSKLDVDADNSNFGDSNSNLAAPSGYFDGPKQNSSTDFKDDFDLSDEGPQLNVDEVRAKIVKLRRQYDDYKTQHAQKAQEISSIQNQTLRQRMQETLDNLESQMIEKELEIKDCENML